LNNDNLGDLGVLAVQAFGLEATYRGTFNRHGAKDAKADALEIGLRPSPPRVELFLAILASWRFKIVVLGLLRLDPDPD